MTLSVVCWRWGTLFSAEYVNILRNMLERHLHSPHQLYCITDDPNGIDERVKTLEMPRTDEFRCRRRMWQYSRHRVAEFGERMLCIDLDVVITADITELLNRTEPLVCWRVSYANVFSGSFILQTPGALNGAWQNYRDDPFGYPKSTGLHNASDQAMINQYLKGKQVATWTEADGIRPFFGKGYERFGGINGKTTQLPSGTKIVVLGSEDKHIMDERKLPWVKDHWR